MIKANTNPHELAQELSGFHCIDGQLVPAINGETFAVLNPATGQDIGRAAAGSNG